MIASALFAQQNLWFGSVDAILHTGGNGDSPKMPDANCLAASRLALLLGPWLGILAALDLREAAWLSAAVSALAMPLLVTYGVLSTAEPSRPKQTWQSLLSLAEVPAARSAVLFVLFWRFMIAFAFYAFNLMVCSNLSARFGAEPRLLAGIGTLSCIGELLGIKLSRSLRAQSSPLVQQHGGLQRMVLLAFATLAVSRCTAFLATNACILLPSLLLSILAATLLNDFQQEVALQVCRQLQVADGAGDVLDLEKAVDALAGVIGPLYAGSVLTQHSPAVAMTGILALYALMYPLVQLGLRRIVLPFLARVPPD